MHTHTLLCFGAHRGAGNPALVIEHDDLDRAGRQALARTRDTTCVFLDASAHGLTIDFYYPHARSPLCVHATLAVAAVLFARQASDAPIAVRTALAGQVLELVRDGDLYFVRLARYPVPALDVDAAAVAALLRAPVDALAAPAAAASAVASAVASVGSPKLLVEMRDLDALHALTPGLVGIAAWGRTTGVNGMYAYCRRADGEYEGRNFNHLDPRLEDSATGVAAGALTALLGHGLVLRQGRATGPDCVIRTRVEGDAILVGGMVETLDESALA